jgi:hypothetical protein
MADDRATTEKALVSGGVRPSGTTPLILFLSLWAAFGVVSFVLISRWERQYNVKMAMIQSGAVQPQTLYITRINPHLRSEWGIHLSRRPGPSQSGEEDVYERANTLDGLSLGSRVPAYRIDGKWFVPRFGGGINFRLGRWVLLCLGVGPPLLVATIALAVRAASKRLAMPAEVAIGQGGNERYTHSAAELPDTGRVN